ncbi:MAG TPA: DinB family protein [Pyrinomonadaceae bacterium]|jgi:hypothetical protein
MSAQLTARPDRTEYPPYFEGYVSLVPDGDVLDTLSRQIDDTLALVERADPAWGDHRYAPEKWSVKEVFGHMIDSERVFNYRVLCFARGDRTPLPGFDQDDYMRLANFSDRALADLAAEFAQVRRTTLLLFRGLDDAAWPRRGVANNNEATVRAMAYIIAGHERHHVQVLRTKYL